MLTNGQRTCEVRKADGNAADKNTCLPESPLRGSVANMLIAFANTKGGVGKSTLAVHLAVWLHDQGFQTALLDTDKQRSSSTWIAEAEPKITIAVADTPDECLVQARGLSESHDFVVADGAAGIDDLSRTLLLLADLALLPISPSILDLRSVQQATSILRFAQQINHGKPEGRLLLNKMRTRETISRELRTAAAGLGIAVAETVIRDLQAYRDAAQQATTVTRMTRRADQAASEVHRLFDELLHKTIAATAKKINHKEASNG